MSLSDALSTLEAWAMRQPAVVDAEEERTLAVLIGVVCELARVARDVDVLECQVRGLEAAVRLLVRGEPVDLAWHERLQRDCLDRRRAPWAG